MRRITSAVVRSPLPLAAVVYTLLRWTAVAGTTPARFPDSTGWLSLSTWGENERFWPVPLVYSLAGTDDVRVLVQVLLGAAAWTWLASAVGSMTRRPRTASLVVLVVGLTPQVVRYDLAILGESLGSTALVALVAASVQLARGTAGALPWFATLVLFGLVRPTHLVVLVPVAAWFAVSAMRSKGARHLGAAVLLGAASVWGVALARGNEATSRLNVYTVIAHDVIVDDDSFSWWVDRGMPAATGLREAVGYDFSGDLPPDLAAIVDLPEGQQPPAVVRAGGVELAEWVRSDGLVTLARWVVTRPRDTWATAVARASRTLSPPNDDFLPLGTRAVAPRVLFGDWRLWGLAWAGGVLAGFVFARRRAEGRMLALSGIALCGLYLVTVTFSGIEHQRHAATVAVGVRVLGLVGLAMLAPGGRLNRDGASDDGPDARMRGGDGSRRGRGRTSRSTTRDTGE